MDQEQIPKDWSIYADNAYPQTIKACRSHGYNALPCTKGAGSILDGIQIMRRFKIAIHSDSRQLIQEFSSYTWKVNQQGAITGVPIDNWNHGIDSVRYWCIKQLPQVMLGNPRHKRTARAKGYVKRF
jgi:phage terminase large subunit